MNLEEICNKEEELGAKLEQLICLSELLEVQSQERGANKIDNAEIILPTLITEKLKEVYNDLDNIITHTNSILYK